MSWRAALHHGSVVRGGEPIHRTAGERTFELIEEAEAAAAEGDHAVAAIESLEELLALAPDDIYALRTSSVVAVRGRDWERASAHFGAYLLFHPESGNAHLMMGNLLVETGEVDAALDHLERSVEFDPQQPLVYWSLGSVYEQVGRPQDAIASFERYLDLAGDPPDAGQIRTTIALLRRSSQNETI